MHLRARLKTAPTKGRGETLMAIQVAIIGCGGMANGHLSAYLTIHEDAKAREGQALALQKGGASGRFERRAGACPPPC